MIRMMSLRAVSLAVAIFALPMVIGCNTMEGAGEDIQAAGEGIKGAASKSKSY